MPVARSIAKFDDRFASPQQRRDIDPARREERLQANVCDVAASHPDELGWRAAPDGQFDEIAVLADHDCAGPTGSVKDRRIGRFAQPEVA